MSLEWGDATFRPQSAQELLEVRCGLGGRLLLRLYDDEVPYGQFNQLEEFLVRHGIPYDRQSEGKYEYDPELVYYRPPHDPVALLATSAGRVVVRAAPLWLLAERFSASCNGGDIESARLLRAFVRQLRRALPPEPPPLPEFEIQSSPSKLNATRGHRPTP